MTAALPLPRAAGGLGRWGVTALVSACFALSYVDRQVLSLLVPSVKRSLDLSDSEIGLLQGISFSLFYVLAAVPLARLADRRDRSRLMGACVAVWSVMTMACGLAVSFLQLLAARIGLAMAEAGLPPAALTLMNDLHDKRGLARATALFMLAPFVGGGLALVGGGALVEWARGIVWPGGLEAWQVVFIAAGIPGLLIAPFVVMAIRDPRARAPAGTGGGASLADLRDYVAGSWRFTVLYMLGTAIIVLVLNAHIAWMPAAILRRFPVGEGAKGAAFGVSYLIAGSIGTLAAGYAISMGEESSMLRRTMTQMRNGAFALAPFAVIAPFAPGYAGMIATAALAVFFTSAVVSMGSIPFQIAPPPGLRAQMIALAGLFAALVGTGLGPITTGVLSDALAASGAAQPLSLALAAIGGAAALIGGVLIEVARRHAMRLHGEPHGN